MVIIADPNYHPIADIEAIRHQAILDYLAGAPNHTLSKAGICLCNYTGHAIQPHLIKLDGSDNGGINVASGQFVNLYPDTVPNDTNYLDMFPNWNPNDSFILVKRDIYSQLPDTFQYFDSLSSATAVFIPTGDPHNFFTTVLVIGYKLALANGLHTQAEVDAAYNSGYSNGVQDGGGGGSAPLLFSRFFNGTSKVLKFDYTDIINGPSSFSLNPNEFGSIDNSGISSGANTVEVRMLASPGTVHVTASYNMEGITSGAADYTIVNGGASAPLGINPNAGMEWCLVEKLPICTIDVENLTANVQTVAKIGFSSNILQSFDIPANSRISIPYTADMGYIRIVHTNSVTMETVRYDLNEHTMSYVSTGVISADFDQYVDGLLKETILIHTHISTP